MSDLPPAASPGAAARSGRGRLGGRRLLLARAAWLAVALLALGLFAASLPAYYRSVNSFSIGQINDPSSVRAGLEQLGLSAEFYAAYILAARIVFLVVHVMVAALIFARRSDEPVALLFSLSLIASAVALNTTLESLWRRYPGTAPSIAAVLCSCSAKLRCLSSAICFPMDGSRRAGHVWPRLCLSP